MAMLKDGGAPVTTQSLLPRKPISRIAPDIPDIPRWDDWQLDSMLTTGGAAPSTGALPGDFMKRLGLADITKSSFAPTPDETVGMDDITAGLKLASSGSTKGMNPGFASALAKANAAMQAAGLGSFKIVSGFRSREQQAALYQKYLRGEGNLAAKPGNSRHEHGTAVDINWSQLNAKQQAWLRANLPRFGVINTGMSFSQKEPWHFEWGGS